MSTQTRRDTEATNRIREEAPRLLIVDDDEDFRMVLQENIEMEGYQVSTAGNGNDALDVLACEEFNVVILDLRMPGMDGIAALEEMNKRGIRSRVIMLTGVDDLGAAVRAVNLGASEYLTKPFEIEVLLGSIERALNVQAGTHYATSRGEC